MLSGEMLAAQEKLLLYSTDLEKICSDAALGANLKNNLEVFDKNLKNFKLIMPVIGNFSSGKSTLLNTFLGEKILPTNIKPETALAVELYYGETPYFETVTKDGVIAKHDIGEFANFENSENRYENFKLYLNNEKLKAIEPFILVDMPGFDAPNENHNIALYNYIGYGAHYLVITSVEEGTLSQILLRKLNVLIDEGKEFSIFLNKTDLKTDAEIKSIVEEINRIIQEEFYISGAVCPVNHHSADNILKNILAINANRLCGHILIPKFSEICYEILENINIKIAAIRKSRDQIESAIAEMTDSINKLKAKADEDAANIRATYSSGMVDEIVRKVGNELNSSCTELVNLAVGGNQAATERRLNDIVNSALFNALRDKLGDVNMQICRDFSNSIAGLDRIMKDLEIDDDFVEKMTFKIQTAFNSITELFSSKTGASGIAGLITSNPTLNIGYKAVTGGMLAAGITMPVIGALLVFLPEILNFLFKGSNEEKARSAIRNKLESEVFPAVKRQVRVEITPLLQKEVGAMIDQVRNQYDAMIEEKRDLLAKEASVKKEDSEARSQELQKLEQSRSRVLEIINNMDEMPQ